MKTIRLLVLAALSASVAGFVVALRSGTLPLGVRGEWEWLRVPFGPGGVDVVLAASGVTAYAGFAALGVRALRARATPIRESVAVAALLAASVAVQWVAHNGAPAGYGLAKWVGALSQKGSSGYFTVAKAEVDDPWRFLAGYPEWVRGQDALHIGTHPPGLIMAEAALLRAMERSPAAARFVVDNAPGSVAVAFRVFERGRPMSPADRATLILTGLLTMLACAGTVVPLYLLARSSLRASAAWSATALWPLVPSAVLFQPAADTAFPVASTAALALAAHAGSARAGRSAGLGVLTGVVLGIGMQFSLVFLPVGLVVALTVVSARGPSARGKAVVLAATGAGFLGVTLAVWALTRADPFVTWWWNQKNHARFYDEFPRSYRAWVPANAVELVVALGLPVSGWAVAGLSWPRGLPRVSVATAAVLAVLTLSGRNLSEVARLWLPFMPALVVASGFAMERLKAGPGTLAATVALLGAQTLALEATIQVVYPV